MVNVTLDRMSRGGIYDQVGGGFHRYATDADGWCPLRKDAYDNALLSRLYLHRISGGRQARWRRWPRKSWIICWMICCHLRAGSTPPGMRFRRREGKYYLWTAAEMDRVLGEDLSAEIKEYYGVSPGEILRTAIFYISRQDVLFPPDWRTLEDAPVSRRERVSLPAMKGTDLLEWLVLTALSEAALVLHRHDYLSASVAVVRFFWTKWCQAVV